MKAEATKLLKKPKLLMILGGIASLVLIAAIGPVLILPRYTAWQNLKDTNKQEAEKLTVLTNNVSVLTKLDKDEVADYKKLLSALLPETEDTLRAVSITDQISKNSGMALESIQVTTSDTAKVTKKVSTVPAGTSQKTLGVTQPGSVSSPQLKTNAAGALSSYTINITLHGDFSSALGLINTLGLVKRTLGITSISFSKAASTERATINLSLEFPLTRKAAASPEQRTELSTSQRKALEDLLDTLTIDASPSTLPVGKTDPLSP
ncbi:MAG: hypothetical protein A2126_02250 [Candidatus Woykebacteria bacterium GWB1_45_5]|uniref:Uncharacterized protein n=2 Tax=Candidatus Woykeibacteriota TaxID=1817899 RepID=A0A1G1W328_9BACT|nr:MAG: hypothetical protein A2113_02670 [Candidatus Woykebacteria bacterium GWA1_44_8]OGY23952.1 MAG: hypothetical protein A2126_02250 [Candidatus Woykebacteria bacterium GWB1_45_5]